MDIILRWEECLINLKVVLILCTLYVVCPAQCTEISSVKIQVADSKLKANGWSLSRNCVRYFRNMLQLLLVKKMQPHCSEQVRRLSKTQSVWYFVTFVQGEIYYINWFLYVFQALQQEVDQGFRVQGTREDHCHCFKRNITDLQGNLSDPQASKYIDIHPLKLEVNKTINEEHQNFVKSIHSRVGLSNGHTVGCHVLYK